jgi:hypothetical protein
MGTNTVNTRRTLAVLLLVAVLAIGIVAVAQQGNENTTSADPMDGSRDFPWILVATGAVGPDQKDIDYLRWNTDQFYQLLDDLDLSSVISDSQGWEPIPSLTGGLFGNGHSVTGLWTQGYDKAGLFAEIGSTTGGGEVNNITIVIDVPSGGINATAPTDSSAYAGGLAGKIINNSKIDNVIINTTDYGGITASSTGVNPVYAGGLAGYSENSTIVAHVNVESVNANATNAYAGGLVGDIFKGSITTSVVNVIDVTATGEERSIAGGLVGNSIEASLQDNEVTVSYVNAEAEDAIAGGLVGYYTTYAIIGPPPSNPHNITDSKVTISTVGYIYANSSVSGGTAYAGGFIGYADGEGSITDVIVTGGNISADSFGTSFVGGFIGYANGTYGGYGGNIANAKVDIESIGSSSTDETFAGGLIGYYYNQSSGSSAITNGIVKITGDISVESDDTVSVGGFIGVIQNGKIMNSDVKFGTVRGSAEAAMAGGFIGFAENSSVFSSHSSGNVTAIDDLFAYAGGFIGSVIGGTFNSNTASGNVYAEGNAASAGGFIGIAFGGNASENTVNGGNISSKSTTVSGNAFAGGYIGDVSNNATVYDGHAFGGTVTAEGFNAFAGGYIGTAGYLNVSEGIAKSGDVYAKANGGKAYAGGFIAKVENSSVFGGSVEGRNVVIAESSESVAGSVSYAGGFIGYSSDGDVYSVSSVVDVSIRGMNGEVGGLIGNMTNGMIMSSFASGNVSADVRFTGFAGGFVGNLKNSDTLGSYALGDVTITSTVGARAGGFIGGISEKGQISRSYSHGDVSVIAPLGAFAGGFIGSIENGADGDIIKSYSVGTVTASTGFVGGFIGAIVSGTLTSNLTVDNSFFDESFTAVGVGGSIIPASGITGKSKLELKTLNTFTGSGWDFSLTGQWGIYGSSGNDIGDGYPYIKTFNNNMLIKPTDVHVPPTPPFPVDDWSVEGNYDSVYYPLEGHLLYDASLKTASGDYVVQQGTLGTTDDFGGRYYQVSFFTGTFNVFYEGEASNPDDIAYYITLYESTLKMNSGFELPTTIEVRVGTGAPLTSGYAYNNVSGSISINANRVTDDITITAGGSKPASYNVYYYGDHVTGGNPTVATHDSDLDGLFYVAAGYTLPLSVTVKIGGVDYTDPGLSYSNTTGITHIPGVDIIGDIEITGIGSTHAKYSVTYIGDHITGGNPTEATHGTNLNGVFDVATGYIVPDSVEVTINGLNFVEYTYNDISGTTRIPGTAITGPIVIKGIGSVPVSYNVTYTGQASNPVGTAYHLTEYSSTLTMNTGYYRPASITVTVDGIGSLIAGTDYTYTKSSGSIVIYAASVIGNITINADNSNPVLNVTYNGNGGTTTITDTNNYENGDTVTVIYIPVPVGA